MIYYYIIILSSSVGLFTSATGTWICKVKSIIIPYFPLFQLNSLKYVCPIKICQRKLD